MCDGRQRSPRWLLLALGLPAVSCQPAAKESPAWVQALLRDGFTVWPGVLSASQLRRAKRALHDRWLQSKGDGFGKERQYGLLELDPVFAEFLEAIPQEVEQLMHGMMGPWIVGAFDIYKFHPVKWKVPPEIQTQQKAWSLHSDFPYGHHPQYTKFKAIPQSYPHTVQLIFMVDMFTKNNGGTIMLPGSHRTRKLPQGLDDRLRILNQTRTVTGVAGDLIIYIGQTWHGNDLNTADGPRVGVIAQCLPWYFKPMQSFMYTLPHRVEKQLSQKVKVRLGLKHTHWFTHTATMGYPTVKANLYHFADFLSDMLYHGYRTPYGFARFQRWSLVALSMPAVVFLAARLEAMRLFVALLLGMFLGVAMTMERFGF